MIPQDGPKISLRMIPLAIELKFPIDDTFNDDKWKQSMKFRSLLYLVEFLTDNSTSDDKGGI